jgi:hypothetical protein
LSAAKVADEIEFHPKDNRVSPDSTGSWNLAGRAAAAGWLKSQVEQTAKRMARTARILKSPIGNPLDPSIQAARRNNFKL